ncbi:MAG: ATP-binding protein [Betaproteobacteria bacterium]|jgi:two-component system osmolarity sensor histidine kinase EnvZ|nr:ATP-binding protein [Casimicrobiaceae bacterium]
MTLWPRSLFGRLILLLVAVVGLVALTTFMLFNRDRAALLAHQFNDTKLVQMKALRASLEGVDGPSRRETLARLGREYGVNIVAESERPTIGIAPVGPAMQSLQERLREGLGEGTDVRIAPRSRQLFVHMQAGNEGYWVGFPLPPRQQEDIPTRIIALAAAIIVVVLLAAFAFARYLARPLRELRSAVERVGRGETPKPLPESGTSEIAAVNRGFNAMIANLRQIERDRAVMLAGVSHDLRTPLARLRLGIEMQPADKAMRDGMVADIEEIDRIIDQFLDFARDDAAATTPPIDINRELALCVDRYARAGRDVRLQPGPPALVRIKPTAVSRVANNLIDNGLAYGRPPLEITTRVRDREVVVDVADRGAGIAAADAERLKQPFMRAGEARAREDGAAGAGLGLAIVDRIARLHGGRFDLLPRTGGGTIARVILPAAPA